VRLDHLLSKEHLASSELPQNGGPGARAARVWWRGAQLAETLASQSGNGRASSTATCGWWEGRVVRLGLAVNTLLSPEGTSTPPLVGGLVVSGWFFPRL
jgi:hypothetical protein